jgi:hypothetical protein
VVGDLGLRVLILHRAPPFPPPPRVGALTRIGALQDTKIIEFGRMRGNGKSQKAAYVGAACVVRVQHKSSRPVVTIEYPYPSLHVFRAAPYIQEQNSLRLESNSISDVLLLFFSYVALAWKSART